MTATTTTYLILIDGLTGNTRRVEEMDGNVIFNDKTHAPQPYTCVYVCVWTYKCMVTPYSLFDQPGNAISISAFRSNR